MRATQLISERIKVIIARDNVTAGEMMDDWEEVLQEMAEAGFDVAGLLCDLQTYKADRKRYETTGRHSA